MYDISIRHGGKKWQPDAGDPVRVDVELDAPVAVTDASSLGVVHLADDGTVEKLDASRYGFTYNKEKTAVTAFWFSAEGFSVYAITEGAVHTTDSDPARRLYDFYSRDFNKFLEDGVTPNPDWNKYVPRYFITVEGNKTFRQIIKDGQYLVRPEALPSPLGRTFMGWYLYSEDNKGKTVDGVTYDSEGFATEPFDFDSPIVFNEGETGEHEYVLRSRFDRVGYVIFHEQESRGEWPITAVRRAIMTESGTTNIQVVVDGQTVTQTHDLMRANVDISDIKVTYDDVAEDDTQQHVNASPRMIFRGWSLTPVKAGALTDTNGVPISIQTSPFVFTRVKDTEATPRHLYPVFVNINWLTYIAAEAGKGASYVPPQFYYADEGTNRFPKSERTGYTFTGWYTATNSTGEATGVQVADADGNLRSLSSSEKASLATWGGTIENGLLKFTKNVTLYGGWTEADTDYTVVFWRQKATDAPNLADTEKQYDFAESVRRTARTGNSASVTSADKSKGGNGDYEGFSYSRCSDAAVVEGSGKTVLNVYYDRNVHTLKFFTSTPSTTTTTTINYTYGGKAYSTTPGNRQTNYLTNINNNKKKVGNYYVSYRNSNYYIQIGDYWYVTTADVYNATAINVETVTGDNSISRITALYGASIKDYFPIVGDDGTVYTGKTWTDKDKVKYDERLAAIELMPDADITFTQASGQDKTGTIYYYVEVGSEDEMGEDGTTHNNKFYKLYNTIVHDFNWLTYKEDFYPIAGYTNDISNSSIAFSGGRSESLPNNSKVYFYYDREPSRIAFVNSENNEVIEQEDILYSDRIASHVPSDPEPADPGYSFTGWYIDESCSTRAFFTDDEKYRSYTKNKVLFERMPANNLQLFAGWEAKWYLITIDPNGGQLAEGQSLWFWKTYGFTDIQEYTTTSRAFVESRAGKWFYALRDRAYHGLTDEWEDREDDIGNNERRAYYTTDQSDDAIVPGKRYDNVANAYRYAGWYEVKKDAQGNETESLYAFGQPVRDHLYLRLHWKHIGTYRLHYEAGEGKIAGGDENESILRTLDAGAYADESEILVTRTAEPPKGSAFLGWRIRGGDGKLLHPGHSFIFNSAYTQTALDAEGNTIKQLTLDAVYDKVMTVSLTTDANGGFIDGAVATTLPLAYPNAPTLITNITDTTRTVSGMRNNAYGHLSDGAGYHCVVQDDEGNDVTLELLGWNTKADGTGTHFDRGQYVGVDTLDTPDGSGHNVLYAEWGVPVYFDKNNDEIGWSHDKWQAKWGDKFTYVESRDQYMQLAYLNGYATYPEIVRDSSTDNKMFAHWSTVRFKQWDKCPVFDFAATPITKPTVLYAIWRDYIEVPFHVVDASGETIVRRDGWLKNAMLRVSNETDIQFDTQYSDYVTVPDEAEFQDYVYAFTGLGDSEGNVSEDDRIVRLWFNPDLDQRCTWVEYANGETGPQPSDKTVHIVYYKNPKTVKIGYREIGADGFKAVAVKGGTPDSTSVGTDAYDMAASLRTPMSYPSDASAYKHYAFAIGETNATTGAQLRFITEAKDDNTSRPPFQIRNTWRGFQYSTDNGATWSNYGFDAQLYVVYFSSQPTIVTLKEQTIGTAEDMAAQFEYDIVISNIVTTVRETQTSTKEGRTASTSSIFGTDYDKAIKSSDGTTYYVNSTTWSWSGSPRTSSETDSFADRSVTGVLQDGGVDTITLLQETSSPNASWDESITAVVGDTVVWGSNRKVTLTNTRTRTASVTTGQKIIIIQRPKAGFATENDNGDGAYRFTCESTPTASATSVTFTNTREAADVELHVAMSQGKTIDHDDNNWRTEAEAGYTVTIPLNKGGTFTVTEETLLARNKAGEGGVLKADPEGKLFVGVFYGVPDETNGEDENRVVLKGRVTSIGFVKPEGSSYYGLYLNNDTSLALGEYKLYYVYVEMPKIYYMREGANGALTQISPITYVGSALVKMGFGDTDTAQGTEIEVGEMPVKVASSGSGVFRIPLALDGSKEASMNQTVIAAGVDGAANLSAMSGATVAAGDALQLKVENAQLKWSVDGSAWSLFDGEPAIYAVYKETGFDLTIAVKALASAADSAVDKFTVTIASDNLNNAGAFEISGYDTETITPAGGAFTLSVTGGCSVTIHALQDNALRYTVSEVLPEGYIMTNLLINGAAPLSQVQVPNGTVTFMEKDKTVAFTNVKRYDVSFVDEDGAELKAATAYWYGTAADAIATPDAPAKAMDSANLYRFKNWTPALESVQSNTVYTAAYKAIPIPQATQRAANTNIVVTLSEEEAQAREAALVEVLKSVGVDITADDYSEADATEKLNARDPNGLRRWENLVTGTATDQLLLNTVSGNSATISAKMVADPDASIKKDLGYIVLRELRKKGDGDAWRTVAGPFEAGNPSFDIALADGNGNSVNASGLYRLVTLIVPKCDLSITNEIPSTNIIGVLEVKSPTTSTVTAVPWRQLASDPAKAVDITVNNYVAGLNLSTGDAVYALDADARTYRMWKVKADGTWEMVTTVSGAADGTYKITEAGAPDVVSMSCGGAAWVQRANTSKPYFLVGQYDESAFTVEVPGATDKGPGLALIANPSFSGVKLNDLDWSKYAIDPRDTIRIVENGVQTTLWYNNKNNKWGHYESKTVEWFGATFVTSQFVPYEKAIPSGTGFFYFRAASSGFTFTWK